MLLLIFAGKLQLKIVANISEKAYNRGEKMGQKEKLIKKLLSKPKDFTFTEAETLLNYFDYVRSNKGKTSGSRVIFIKEGCHAILLHKPHPRKELLAYQIKTLISVLEQEGLL
nr:type II toxin-antitoxin system HicA family toxin [Phascolarctobacterium succinatutens]